MKGVLFRQFDLGMGGPGGFVHYGKTWCVEHEGKKYHVSMEVREGFHFNIVPCDGTCEKKVDLDPRAKEAFLEFLRKN